MGTPARVFFLLTMPVLELRSVSKSYGERPILQDLSFAVEKGERVALVGPSGSGKTTLLNCIGGVDRPDRGEVRIDDVALSSLGRDGLARLRRERPEWLG